MSMFLHEWASHSESVRLQKKEQKRYTINRNHVVCAERRVASVSLLWYLEIKMAAQEAGFLPLQFFTTSSVYLWYRPVTTVDTDATSSQYLKKNAWYIFINDQTYLSAILTICLQTSSIFHAILWELLEMEMWLLNKGHAFCHCISPYNTFLWVMCR